MDFIEALNNPTTRALIEQIEELEDEYGNVRLVEIHTKLIAELKALGYDWNQS